MKTMSIEAICAEKKKVSKYDYFYNSSRSFLVKGTNGEIYLIKPDIFQDSITYHPSFGAAVSNTLLKYYNLPTSDNLITEKTDETKDHSYFNGQKKFYGVKWIEENTCLSTIVNPDDYKNFLKTMKNILLYANFDILIGNYDRSFNNVIYDAEDSEYLIDYDLTDISKSDVIRSQINTVDLNIIKDVISESFYFLLALDKNILNLESQANQVITVSNNILNNYSTIEKEVKEYAELFNISNPRMVLDYLNYRLEKTEQTITKIINYSDQLKPGQLDSRGKTKKLAKCMNEILK